MTEKERQQLRGLYTNDPFQAEQELFVRVTDETTRRGFLRDAGLAGLTAAIGAAIPFHAFMPAGLMPAAFAQAPGTGNDVSGAEKALLQDKKGLVVLNDRPINAETPPHLLDDAVTPSNLHFVRNNGLVPPAALKGDVAGWTLTIDGEVERPLTLTLDQLANDFEVVTRQILIECAGNGRAFFNPGASGNQWSTGAVSCSEWTGVRLKDVLDKAGVKKSAVYTGHYGTDVHLSGDTSKVVISRGVPIDKAMDEANLIAFKMNGEAIPALHGFPLRLIVAGWVGSCSQKWLNRISLRDRKHDGPKMEHPSYAVPKQPVAPGQEVSADQYETITSLPVKSLITSPRTGVKTTAARPLEVRGHAWAGDRTVSRMDVSIDFGQTWQEAQVDKPANRGAWQHWRANVKLPQPGYYEVWARATDSEGRAQPPVSPGWNPKGYFNNVQHRIAVFAE